MRSLLGGWFVRRSVDPSGDVVQRVICQVMKSAPGANTSGLFEELEVFIPHFTELILSNLIDHMIAAIGSPDADRQTTQSVLRIFLKMIEQRIEADPSTDPFPFLAKQPLFLPHLFLNSDQLGRELDLIRAILERRPEFVRSFVRQSPCHLMPLIKTILWHRDKSLTDLILLMIGSDRAVLSGLDAASRRYIREKLQQFPVSLVSTFVAAIPDLRRDLLPGMEKWLLSQTSLRITDLERFIEYLPEISHSSLRLFAKVEPFQDVAALGWIRSLPSHEFEVDDDDLDLIVEEFLHPKVALASVCERYGPQTVVRNPVAGITFLRLFALSRADPSRCPREIVSVVCDLLSDANEWISAAAAQVLMIWIVVRGQKVPVSVVYKCAGACVDEAMNDSYCALFRALLRASGSQHQMQSSRIVNTTELVMRPTDVALIQEGEWMFAHLGEALQKVSNIVLPTIHDSLNVLGFVVAFLGLNHRGDLLL